MSCRSLWLGLLASLILLAVLRHAQIAQFRGRPALVVHKADAGDIGFDDVDFLQRRDDEQLQIELLEQAQAVLRRFV